MSFVSVIMPVYNEVCVEKVIEFYWDLLFINY